MPSNEFAELVKNSESLGQILKTFGLSNKGGNCNTVKRRILAENIDMSHIRLGKGSNKGRKFHNKEIIPDEIVFSENSNFNRHSLKKRIRKQKLIPYICSDCGQDDVWNGKTLSLQLEHKNGIPNDNRIENLSFLCPNCHSQTPTFAGKNRNPKPKVYKDTHYPKTWLRKVERPSKENLAKLMDQHPLTTIGKIYGVSDSAIRKWAKYYKLTIPKKKFWGNQYTKNSGTTT
jgi:hypothetical protein